MSTLQILHNARRVLLLRPLTIAPVSVRLLSDTAIGERPWDKSTRAVIQEIPDVSAPSEIKSRQLPGMSSNSPQNYEPNADKNVQKGRIAEAHFDLRYQNWERNQNKDFRSQMKQWDMQQQVFKTSRLIKHQEYGTYESNRGNISGRPSPSNTTPSTHQAHLQTETTHGTSDHHQTSSKGDQKKTMTPPSSPSKAGKSGSQASSAHTQ